MNMKMKGYISLWSYFKLMRIVMQDYCGKMKKSKRNHGRNLNWGSTSLIIFIEEKKQDQGWWSKYFKDHRKEIRDISCYGDGEGEREGEGKGKVQGQKINQ
jgi:hypothetical protein